MTPTEWEDDDRLLAELRAALATHQDVPADLLRAGKSVFDWRQVDQELAEMTYDSATLDRQEVIAVARGVDPPRAMTLRSDQLVIELELAGNALRGQLVPALDAAVELDDGADEWFSVRCDAQGFFVVPQVPPNGFRLTVRAAGVVVRTGWIAR